MLRCCIVEPRTASKTSRSGAGTRTSRAAHAFFVDAAVPVPCTVEEFYVVSPAVPNGAGDHRAARTPPWRGAVRWSPPTRSPPTYNGLYEHGSRAHGSHFTQKNTSQPSKPTNTPARPHDRAMTDSAADSTVAAPEPNAPRSRLRRGRPQHWPPANPTRPPPAPAPVNGKVPS